MSERLKVKLLVFSSNDHERIMKFTLFSRLTLSMAPLDVFGQQHVPSRYVELLADGLSTATGRITDRSARRDLAVPFQDGRLLRELELNEACSHTINMLWEDQALNDTFTLYIGNQLATEDSCLESGNDLFCTSSEPNGAEEFRSACNAARGEVLVHVLDIACNKTLEGEQFNLYFDSPGLLDCIPTTWDDGCTDAYVELVRSNLVDSLEENLSSDGAGNCRVGDVILSSTSDNAVQAMSQAVWFTLVAVIAPIIFC